MADEQPRRFKGAKHLEAGYRAGYAAGHRQGLIEAEEAGEENEKRERLMQAGLAKLRAEQQAKPKRARRKTVTTGHADGSVTAEVQ